jgi:DNA-binding PadR family transcriptional regulator
MVPTLPLSTLLVPGRTLLFLPSLVTAIGLNEAIALQQLRYRLADERAPRTWEGKRWARASVQTWQERDFLFWSIKTVQRTFESLERQGFVHSAQPDLARRDGTKWYTINFAALEPLAKMIAGRSHGRAGAASTGASDGNALPPLSANDLLLAEPPLVILVDLAVRVGLDEAIIMQQLRYWLADERKPPIRDGQRWVCPRDINFFDPLTHRSPAVLERILRRLEQAGLVRASARYNVMPGDRTKWYTLNFEAIEQLAAKPDTNVAQHQMHHLTKSKVTNCPIPDEPIDQTQSSQLTNTKSTECPSPKSPVDHDQMDGVTNSLKGSETDSTFR